MSEAIVVSHAKVTDIINSREPKGLFIELSDGKYIGIDNSTGDAWVEEFDNISDCKAWLKRKPERTEK